MRKRVNPVQKNGDRNLFCIHYNDCLGHAAKQHWKYWSCFKCPYLGMHQTGIQGPITSDESILYYRIPRDIYQKVIS